MTMKQISPKIRKATTIRTLVVKAPTSSKRALTIKALPALERPKDKPLPLASVYGKSEEKVSQIIQEWKSDNGAAALLEHLKAPDLVRIRQLLDWYVEGYSVQADSYEQLEIIKDMIAGMDRQEREQDIQVLLTLKQLRIIGATAISDSKLEGYISEALRKIDELSPQGRT